MTLFYCPKCNKEQLLSNNPYKTEQTIINMRDGYGRAIYQKRGSCCVRNKIIISTDGVKETMQLRDTSKSENEWIVDTEIPVFKNEGRKYIDRLVHVGEE